MAEQIFLKKKNSSLSVHPFGATVLSWKVDGNEMLFVSQKAIFDNKKAIRGGIPFVFPQFGPWDAGPQHGFARITKWSAEKNREKENEATFLLRDTENTRNFWNNRFQVKYVLILEENELGMQTEVTNTGNSNFSFHLLLHTYLNVPDVTLCNVKGLKGCSYIDKTKGEELFVEDRDNVVVNEFTDRVYCNSPSEQVVTNVSGEKSLKIIKDNFPDTVIWNPWAEKAKGMSDFGDEEYTSMLCVEAGFVSKAASLDPGQSFCAEQILRVI